MGHWQDSREMPGVIELTQAVNKLGNYRQQNMPRTLDEKVGEQ